MSTFKLSNDKAFAEKLEAIIGLYVSPPENAIVLSCDEKSQIQALDRTQPGLPMKKSSLIPQPFPLNSTSIPAAPSPSLLTSLTGSVLQDDSETAQVQTYQDTYDYIEADNEKSKRELKKISYHVAG